MDSHNENNNPQKNDFWHIFKAAFAAIVTLMTIVGGVFVFVKFSIIESRDINYQSQIDTLKTTISQHESKISYLEKENQTLASERDRYFDYLVSMPESIYYFEKKMIDLENKNSELESSLINSDNALVEKYYTTYDNQKENVAVVDEITGLVFCINEIEYSGIGHATLSLPGLPSESKDFKSGDVFAFSQGDKNYQIIISMLSWGANSYSIIIKEV